MDCKNCGSNLRDKDGFCSDCGARVIDERITLKFLTKELLDKVLSVDNKLLKTFLHMFSKPEKVIDGYITGVRKRYVEPFTFLLISITLSGIAFYLLKEATIESIEAITVDPAENNPLAKKKVLENYLNFIFDYQAIFTAVVIPIYAFIAWVVFLNRKRYNFYEYIIIFIYVSAQGGILNFVVSTPSFLISKEVGNIVSMSVSIISFLYIGYVLIRLFKLTFLQFIIKTLYFMVISSFLYLVLSILAIIITLLVVGTDFFRQFRPDRPKDSIQKIQKIDSTKLKQKDSVKSISYYEASSKLNCLS